MDHYELPEDRTWCEGFRCCREKDHDGDCEIDITYLTRDELDAIRRTAKDPANWP